MASFSFGCLGQPAHGLVSTGLLTTLALEYAKAEFAVAQPWGCSERMLEEPQEKNGFVARVASRRGLFPRASQGRLFPPKRSTERVEELLASQRFAKALYLKRVPRVRIPPHPFVGHKLLILSNLLRSVLSILTARW